ncbi:alpha/beta hydrolase [Chryseobacterium binzhouense]|uniref:alpha/beta hydrolase n=1 Tax=Chryseobacterium binzhouense TaxID=2593646 RepID=UPI00117FAFBE|nr:alpha/beta hydrolase [Chryseobacterium binzhouense]MXS71929.1 alpha/beta hydrolase fold domain-containing protein [Flavobacteriaceae bacterium W22]
MNNLLKLAFIILISFSCKKKDFDLGNNIIFNKETNISYGDNSLQKLDWYFPLTKDSVKGIFVIVHGGGWKAGNKSQLNFFMYSLMRKFPDYAFANINYRLANNNTFILPNQTDDIQHSISLLTEKCRILKINPDFILLGNSAGAHLSMLYGYNDFMYPKKYYSIKAIVNIVGPSDLYDKNFEAYPDYYFVKNRMIDLSASVPKDLTNKDIPNPIFWISEKSPPTISFYGNRDQIIPLSQKTVLDSVLNKNKVYNQSFEFSGGHLDWENEKNTSFLIDRIDIFLANIK